MTVCIEYSSFRNLQKTHVYYAMRGICSWHLDSLDILDTQFCVSYLTFLMLSSESVCHQ